MSATTSENPSDNRSQLHPRAPDALDAHSSQYQSQERSQSRVAQSVGESSSKPNVRFLDQLRILPEIRPIPWRQGQELPRERSIDSPRVQQRGAILLATRGKISETPCTHCEAGYGRFSVCITLDRWFQGACSSCIFTSKGNKCSLRHQISGNADGRALRYHTDNPEVLQSVIRDAAENPKPVKKRKKRPTESLVDDVYADPSAQPYSPFPQSPDSDTLLQAQIAREQDELVNEPQAKKRQRVSHASASASSNNPTYPTAGGSFSQVDSSPIALNTIRPRKTSQTLFGVHTTQELPNSSATPIQGRANPMQGPSTPIIDTFPKAKQKQIYGFISGVSNGIKNLQKELDSLRAVLGIDSDDPTNPY